MTQETKKERILVVDHEKSIQEMISKVVETMDGEVVTANDGKEALEILNGESFSILFTDITMPGSDGFELMKTARVKFPSLSVVCMTAPGASYLYNDLVAFGATDYINKPFTSDELMAKLNRVIRDQNLIRDLTQRLFELKSEDEEQKRLDQLKSNFISGISHELRTPLTVIKEIFSLVFEGRIGTLTEDQKEYLGIASKNVIRLTSLIDGLLDFSRIESGKELKLRFEPVRLIPAIEEVWMTLSQSLGERGITFENHLDPETPMVLADRHRLLEVLANLISDGMKFISPGGKITINLRGLTEKRDYLKVAVTYIGGGVPSEDLPKVFDRFYQGQKIQEGTKLVIGLGLSVTKEIIEGHQGFIEAENKPENGTTFIFTLPLLGVNTIVNLLLNPMLKKAERDKMPLSLIQMEFWDQWTKREATISDGVLEGVVYAVKMMVRSFDMVIPFQNHRVYIFSFTDKKLAKEIGERVQTKLNQGGYIPKGTHVQFRTYSYTKDARNPEDFLKGCRLFLKED